MATVITTNASSTTTTNTCPIELWFVRHGESKNNAILSAAAGLGAVMYPVKFSQDPYITEKGIAVATENGRRLVEADAQFDLVFCSAMIRTIETSYYMFVKTKVIDKVYVAPFISELPLTFAAIPIYENMPLARLEQIKLLGKNHGSDLLDHVDWSLVGGPGGDNQATLPPNGDKFLKWLFAQEIVTALLAEKPKLKIGVVTHSHFLMEKDTLHLDKKPDNADIWLANMHIMPVGKDLPPLLSLTDLRGWYQQTIASMRDAMDHKIERTAHRAEKTHDKLTAKLEKLSMENESDDEKDLEKKLHKKEKYLEKLDKKEHKYAGKKEHLEVAKSQLVNLSDVQTQEYQKRKMTAEQSADAH